MITPIVLIASGVVLAVATLLASFVSKRRHQRRDPLGAALEHVSGSLRLTAREEALVRRLGGEAGVAPVTLLISGDALDRASQGASAEEAAMLVSIRRKGGAGAERAA